MDEEVLSASPEPERSRLSGHVRCVGCGAMLWGRFYICIFDLSEEVCMRRNGAFLITR